LYQKYIIENLSQHKIGAICHVGQHTITKWLKDFGIKKRAKKVTTDSFIRNGYRMIYAPDDPKAFNRHRMEHLIVAEKMLGRSLKKGETVHHIDGNRTNNSQNNLCICENNSTHQKVHISLKNISYMLINYGVIGFDFKRKRYFIRKP